VYTYAQDIHGELNSLITDATTPFVRADAHAPVTESAVCGLYNIKKAPYYRHAAHELNISIQKTGASLAQELRREQTQYGDASTTSQVIEAHTRMFPLLLTSLHVLESDFGICLDDVQIQTELTPTDFSASLLVPDLGRAVFLDVANASLHCHVVDVDEAIVMGLSYEELRTMKMTERAEHLEASPKMGCAITSHVSADQLRDYFEFPFVDRLPSPFISPPRSRDHVPELDHAKLPYVVFAHTVQTTWESLEPRPSSIQEWYHQLGTDRPATWPSNPQKYYSQKGGGKSGWVSWPALIGKEKPQIVPYAAFKKAVTEAWKKAGRPRDIQAWYATIGPDARMHGWPGNPENYYKAHPDTDGAKWQSWREMVGEEKRAPQLPYTAFKEAVTKAWIAAGRPRPINQWYQSIDPRPQGWDSNPQQVYKVGHKRYKPELGGAWSSWHELVGETDGRLVGKN
jgi:hypothetical protein